MTNTDIATEVHRLERVNSLGLSHTMELPRDEGNPPTITLHKLVSRIDVFTDL
jgi:hypothetical protein